MSIAAVCKLEFVPTRWHNFAIVLAQDCHRIGTTLPLRWHKYILATAGRQTLDVISETLYFSDIRLTRDMINPVKGCLCSLLL